MTRNTEATNSFNWMEGLPEKELYDIYSDTLSSRFPAFGIRSFEEATPDMSQSFHSYDSSGAIDQDIINVVVTPNSLERYTTELAKFTRMHGLQGWLDYGNAVIFATDHGQFTDVPITAETIGRIGLGCRQNTLQVVSEMITTMVLDLGSGAKPVINTLRNISGVVTTIPRLDGTPSPELVRYRETKNESGLIIMSNAVPVPSKKPQEGSITVLSAVGRHNQARGGALYIHEPNKRTLEVYEGPHIKVVPIYMHCPTFGDKGTIESAEMKFELFPPMQIEDPRKDTRKIISMFKQATNGVVGHQYTRGVKIRSWNAQQTARNTGALRRRVTNSPDAPSTDEY